MSKKNIFQNLVANTGSYVDQAIAIIKGDDAAALAAKIEVQVRNTLTSAVSAATAELNDLKEAVADAKEELRLAILNNGNEVKGPDARQAFLRQLNSARTRLVQAEKTLAVKQEEHDFFDDAHQYLNGKGQTAL